MTFQKSPNQLPQESMLAVESRGNIRNVLEMIAHDGSVNKQANLYDFKALYKEKRFDLEAEFAKRPETRKREKIVGEFIHDIKHGAPSELAEMLPLLANQPGRLGDYIEAHVTKTARPDDQGNSFIDLVVEIKNTFLATEQASREMKDVKTKMTFLVDITAATGQSFNVKQEVLRDEFLVRGKRANVLCYQDSLGTLGIERPKIIVAKSPNYMEKVGAALGATVTQKAGDSFIITNPGKFNDQYRNYFKDLMFAIKENAEQSVVYMKSLVPDEARAKLIREYLEIIAFADAYQKTPTTRTKGS